MILYVNGDSHSAGYEAGGIEHSYGKHLADKLNAELICHAKPGCSNDRIIRITKEYLKNNTPNLIIIGWTTWEREEWLHNEKYYCVNSSGHSRLPADLQPKYKEWVLSKDHNSINDERLAHQKIWDLHQELKTKKIPHIFFNCYLNFTNIVLFNDPQFDWGDNYLDPYTKDSPYWHYLTKQGYKSNQHLHFGEDAHQAWANHLTNVINERIIIK